MKLVIQDLRGRQVEVRDVPAPQGGPGLVLVRNAFSLISSGTERAAVESASRSLVGQALHRPDLVRKVVHTVRTRGVREAARAVAARLAEPRALGYSCAGIAMEVGSDVSDIPPGTPVACAGVGYASHAEFVAVPANLAVPVPDGVAVEHASFVAVGAISLHGVRTAEATVGDIALVIGLGLVGLLTAQILKAAGCTVIGVDPSPERRRLATTLGADHALPPDAEAVVRIVALTGGRGVDVALITAATESSEPIRLAGEASRDRGRVCVVGDVGMDVPRAVYYEKELDLRVSRSYGPGRYDPLYEEGGVDYPIGYVRWTERSNMAAFLQLLMRNQVRVAPLIAGRYPIDEAAAAYHALTEQQLEHGVALLLQYDTSGPPTRRIDTAQTARARGARGASLIGAGTFARAVLLPALRKQNVALRGVITRSGATARATADHYRFAFCGTDVDAAFADAETDMVIIATRHDSHASLAVRALRAGKHVFVEKPPALNRDELDRLLDAAASAPGLLTVGYNRRYAPLVLRLKEELGPGTGHLAFVYRVNAGMLPATHWTRDPNVGGGRIIGETCHFVDLAQFLIGTRPAEVSAQALSSTDGAPPDTVSFQIRFVDGSLFSVHYLSLGDPALPKERLEAYGRGWAAVLDDFTKLEVFRNNRRVTHRTTRPDKGHDEGLRRFLSACAAGGPAPIPYEEIALTSVTTFAVVEAASAGRPLPIDL